MTIFLASSGAARLNVPYPVTVASTVALTTTVLISLVTSNGSLSSDSVQLSPSKQTARVFLRVDNLEQCVITMSTTDLEVILGAPLVVRPDLTSADRFRLLYPELREAELDDLEEETLAADYPELSKMISMVKRHSVLLKSIKPSEVYAAITDHADARISLVLISGRDALGAQLFPNLKVVHEVMFCLPSQVPVSAMSPITFASRQILFEGVRRVSAALAASLIIGRLSQVVEQAAHANVLETQALNDLDRILKVPNLLTKPADQVGSTEQSLSFGFFFANWINTDGAPPPSCEVFLGGQWLAIEESYNTTSELVAKLAGFINNKALQVAPNFAGAIVAAPKMNVVEGVHFLELRSRNRDAVLAAEPLTVKFTSLKTPFSWGVTSLSSLSEENTNGVIVTVANGKTSSLGANSSTTSVNELNCLYFRAQSYHGFSLEELNRFNFISYRTSSPASAEVSKPEVIYFVSSVEHNRRALDIARKLHDAFYVRRAKSSVIGILRKDYLDSENESVVVLEVNACVESTSSDACIVLDLLNIPPDVQVGVGTINQIVIPFASPPRSLVLPNLVTSGDALPPSHALGVSRPKSEINKATEKIKKEQGYYDEFFCGSGRDIIHGPPIDWVKYNNFS